MQFSARKSLFVKVFILCSWILSLFSLYYYTHPSIIVLVLSILLLWIYFSTGYEVSGDYFSYKSGPFKGKISVKDIREVKTYENWFYVGWKVGLSAKNGLLIRYNKFDEIFIAPKNKEEFIKALQKKNSKITIE